MIHGINIGHQKEYAEDNLSDKIVTLYEGESPNRIDFKIISLTSKGYLYKRSIFFTPE